MRACPRCGHSRRVQELVLSFNRCRCNPEPRSDWNGPAASERPPNTHPKPASGAFHFQPSVTFIPHQAPAALVAFQRSTISYQRKNAREQIALPPASSASHPPATSFLFCSSPYTLSFDHQRSHSTSTSILIYTPFISLVIFLLTTLPPFHSNHNAYGNTASLTLF